VVIGVPDLFFSLAAGLDAGAAARLLLPITVLPNFAATSSSFPSYDAL
jgi:hypothetical protein